MSRHARARGLSVRGSGDLGEFTATCDDPDGALVVPLVGEGG